MALSSSQLAGIAADLTTLESSYRTAKATYLGNLKHGVYDGANLAAAKGIANLLASNPPDNVTSTAADEALRKSLLLRAQAIVS